MELGYVYAIIIPIAFLIAFWCFYDTTLRGKCSKKQARSDEREVEIP